MSPSLGAPSQMGRRDKRRTSVLQSKTLAQAEFIFAEQAKSRGAQAAFTVIGVGDIIEAFIMEQIKV